MLILILPISIKAQEKLSYASNNQKVEFKISTNEFYVKYNSVNRKTLKSQLKNENLTELSDNYAMVKINNLSNKRLFSKQKIELMDKFKHQFQKIEPVLIYKDGVKQVCQGEIIIKLKQNIDLLTLLKGYKYSSKENEFVKNQFLIKLENTNTEKLFEIVNKLNKHKDIDFAEPNFIKFLTPHTNDTFFNYQWSIKNQGYLGGTVDADMDVDSAWNYATGQGIKVAIIDEGVDLSHPDLTANLLPGFDATGRNSNGAPENDDAHGTACAGIIAAIANNSIGVAGVAYNAKIIPIRIGYSMDLIFKGVKIWVTNNNWTVNGINWAVQNGADILSNSWGGGSPCIAITNAINNAVNNG